MNSIRRHTAYGSLFVAAALFASSVAHAELTKHQCVEANANGQHLLVGGKLTAARAAFQSCATTACPPAVQNDCIKRLDEVDRIQPSIIFEAKDASGDDLSTVAVTVDGTPLVNRLDGTPLLVDPGEHTFVFSATGAPPVTKKYVLAERDQSRRERVVLGLAPPTVQVSAPSSTPIVSAPEERAPVPAGGLSTVQTLGLVSGGVGVVGLGVGIAFAVLAGSASTSQQNDCLSPTNCANHAQAIADHNTFTTDTSVEIAGLVAGGTLLTAGIIMFVAGGRTSVKSGLAVLPSLSPGVAGLTFRGGF